MINFSDIKIQSRVKAVILTGTQDDIQAVTSLLSTIIKDLEVRCIPIPSGKVGEIIGKGGRRIQRIRRTCHVSCQVLPYVVSKEFVDFMIKGRREDIDQAVKLLEAILGDETLSSQAEKEAQRNASRKARASYRADNTPAIE